MHHAQLITCTVAASRHTCRLLDWLSLDAFLPLHNIKSVIGMMCGSWHQIETTHQPRAEMMDGLVLAASDKVHNEGGVKWKRSLSTITVGCVCGWMNRWQQDDGVDGSHSASAMNAKLASAGRFLAKQVYPCRWQEARRCFRWQTKV